LANRLGSIRKWFRESVSSIKGVLAQVGTVPILVLTVSFGIVLRVYVASTLSVDGDEGQFIYQGQLALQGAIPIRDLIPAPDPMYIWLVALMELFLGPTLAAVRMLSVIFSAIAIVGVYFLTTHLTTRRIAVVAALLYAAGPTVVLYNSIGNYRQVAWPMVIVALCFMSVGLRKLSWKHLFLFGAFVGIAATTYRVTGIFLITAPLLIVFMNKDGWRKSLKLVSGVVGGVLSTLLPVVGVIVSASSFEWVNRVWGFGGGIGSASDFAIGTSTSTVASPSLTEHLAFLSRIGFVVAREWYYLILPAAVGLACLFERSPRWTRSRGFALSLVLILAAATLSIGRFLQPNPNYAAYPVWPPYDYATILLIWLGTVALVGLPNSSVSEATNKNSRNMLAYWVLSLIAVFAAFKYPHVFYFIAFAAPLTILASHGLMALWRSLRNYPRRVIQSRKVFPFLMLSIILLSMATAFLTAYTTPIQERDVSQTQATVIGAYVRDHTGPEDEILTGNLIYVISSGRSNALNISNPWIYFQGLDDPFPGNPFHSTPSASQLASHLATGAVRYVILDRLLGQILIQQSTLMSAVNIHFRLDTSIFGVQIYRFIG